MRIVVTVVLFLSIAFAAGCGGDGGGGGGGGFFPRGNPPVMQPQSDTSVALGDTLELWASAYDKDGDRLVYRVAAHLSYSEIREGYTLNLEFDSETGYFRFRPKQEDRPSRQFTFTVDDGHDNSDSTTFSVTVN